jgi:hypothetical protein
MEALERQPYFKPFFSRLCDELRAMNETYGQWKGIEIYNPLKQLADEILKAGGIDIQPRDDDGAYVHIRHALQASGRHTHDQCHEPPIQVPSLEDGIVIAIPGDRIGRRTRVTIATKPVDLTDASLRLLLHLMVALRKGGVVNKVDLGASAETGFKGISNLRSELKPILGSLNIIKSHYHGNYSFQVGVTIGNCAVDKLLEIGDKTISDLAKLL